MGRPFRVYRNLVCLLALQKRLGGFYRKKTRRDNRMKTFYGEMWKNIV